MRVAPAPVPVMVIGYVPGATEDVVLKVSAELPLDSGRKRRSPGGAVP